MRAEEIEWVAGALGQTVTGYRTLAGGFSHETCLLELGSNRAVVRLGGTDPAIEAAVMAAAGECVPVPEVLLVLPVLPAAAGGGAPAGGAARPTMVLRYVTGNLLSEVLDAADETDAKALVDLGAEVGRVFAGIATVTFGRPGFFADAKLAVGEMPPWSEQLPGMAETCMERVPPSRLDPAARRAWARLCAAHAPALTRIDDQARLVHADANPKNVLVSHVGRRWRVDAVLDWEFSFSGWPYADFANMTRFEGSYPPGFVAGFRTGFDGGGPGDLARPDDWAGIGGRNCCRGSVLAVLLLPEVVGLLLGRVPGLVPVDMVVVTVLEVLIDLRPGEGTEHFLTELVVLGDALSLAVVLVHAHGLEASRPRQHLVRDLVAWTLVVVNLVVGALRAAPVKESHGPRT